MKGDISPKLTAIESKILGALTQGPKSRAELIQYVWPDTRAANNTLATHLANLRAKLDLRETPREIVYRDKQYHLNEGEDFPT